MRGFFGRLFICLVSFDGVTRFGAFGLGFFAGPRVFLFAFFLRLLVFLAVFAQQFGLAFTAFRACLRQQFMDFFA